MADMQAMQEEVGKWGRFLLDHATEHTFALKVMEEAGELASELEEIHSLEWLPYNPSKMKDEAADVVIVLMLLATRHGFSLEEAVRRKFERNKLRQWGQPDEHGVVKHIKS